MDARRVRSIDAGEFVRLLESPDTAVIAAVSAVGVCIAVPGGWLFAIPCCAGLIIWNSTRRFRLPFRIPTSWCRADYSNPEPGHSRRYRMGQGLIYLGNEQATNEELWISNSDARRHALVLATTGAGKALPLDTLVLTEHGWVPNGDICPGDRLVHPKGGHSRVLSVHPQGRLPVVRLHFADGRFADCSRDHLWLATIHGDAANETAGTFERSSLMSAENIALLVEAGATASSGFGPARVFLPLAGPADGPLDGRSLTGRLARKAGRKGFHRLNFMPSLAGSGAARSIWFRRALRERHELFPIRVQGDRLRIPVLCEQDGHRLRHVIWSLGGTAIELWTAGRCHLVAGFPGQEESFDETPPFSSESCCRGLEVTGVDVFNSSAEQAAGADCAMGTPVREARMSCIRTDAADGLMVIENHVVTHNTELLLGIAAQSMIWSSGFMFIDGKGTTEFHARVWSLVSRFGRQDDYRVLNFTDAGGHPDDPAGGPAVHSNTLNPFSHGSADQLMNLIVSLMGESGNAGDMWKGRAMSLVTSTMKALCEMRDAGDVLLDVQSIRDYLPLGLGVRKEFVGENKIGSVAEIPQAAWEDMKSRGGMIELHLRAERGEFSERSRLALKGFFDSLPGFNLEAALNGEPQVGKAVEQHGFLAMQLTRPLGSLADDFGHIFRTPFGEVDLDDVVLNRRILVVLLPALQKAPAEMRNCGKIVVSMLKIMMGRAAGSALVGSKRSLVDARPTRSASPFIAVLDEAGHYMVKGIDTMMAQARSLGFMIIIAGQDMAAMQSVSPQIAETVAANARLTAAGATEDAQRTWTFLRNKFATRAVAVSPGRSVRAGFFGRRWVERPDVSFSVEERVKISDLQKLREGEFYFLMESRLVKARAFHAGDIWVPWISLNKFLLIRGPTDRAPGLDQSHETRFVSSMEAAGKSMLDVEKLRRRLDEVPFDLRDALFCSIRYGEETKQRRAAKGLPAPSARDLDLLGIVFGVSLRVRGH